MQKIDAHNVYYVDGVNGHLVHADLPNRRARGHAGCYDSHIKALQYGAYHCREDHFWIIEDDAVFPHRFRMPETMPEDAAIYYLGGVPIQDGMLQTHAYGVATDWAQDIIDILLMERGKIDIRMCEVLKHVPWDYMNELPVKQSDTLTSDISKP
jgi:hypothetical protein